jgi:hypothetical protein
VNKLEDQEILQLIKHLVKLDKEIQRQINELMALMKRDGYLTVDQNKPHYVT